MNFSNTKKLRKMLSLLFVLALTAAMFTGCFGGKEESEETEPNININLAETTTAPETQPEPTVTEPTEINENMATVLSQLTIRSSPSTDATVVGTLYAGDKVEVVRRETVVGTEWGYIITPDTGWICMDYVEMDFEPEVPVTNNTDTPAGSANPTESQDDTPGTTTNTKGVITGNGLNIRSEASTSADIKGTYNKGDVVTILEIKNGWGRTNRGWIKMDYVNTSANAGSTTDKDTSSTDKDNDKTDTPSNITSNGSTTVQFRGIITAKELNIRASASQNAERVGGYEYGDRVEILEQDGNWGRTSKGWISLSYVYEDGTSSGNSVKGTITADGLNIRSGPGKDYGVIGSYSEGDSVTILAQFTYGGTKWGCTKTGWISMDYVDLGEEADKDIDTSDKDSDGQTGYVTGDGVRIRKGPGTDYDVVGSLDYGDEVTVTDKVEDGNGVVWGKIAGGWVSMDYVNIR